MITVASGGRELDRDSLIANAIISRDGAGIARLMFRQAPLSVAEGFRTETELWDYKGFAPPLSRLEPGHERTWAGLAANVLAFYNKRGGLLIFGVDNAYNVAKITGLIDGKIFNEKIWAYLSDRIWVEYQRLFVEQDQSYVGLAVIPPRGERIERFINTSPDGCKYTFGPRQSAIRDGDSCHILAESEADKMARQMFLPTIGKPYIVDETGYRVLQPEYDSFTYRSKLCERVELSLSDKRVAVTSLIGIGGAGKTALATWATLRAYERREFEFIVSITAKDRALTTYGIHALEPSLGSFETLLDAILDTLGYSEYRADPIDAKASRVREIIEGSNGLLFVDNLETVDDARILEFLDELPEGVRAITTSRVARVKVSVRPIMVEELADSEILDYVRRFSSQSGMAYVEKLNDQQCLAIGHACDGLPLAIAWILKRSRSWAEAKVHADALATASASKDALLEFCFRRVFDEMPQSQQEVMRVLSLYQEPLALQPIIAGCNRNPDTMDALDRLVEDSLIQRAFDEKSGTYRFTLLPLVRSFVYSDTVEKVDLDRILRRRLTDWFEARDVQEANQRLVERELRQGRQASDESIVLLARQASERGDVDNAQRLYEYALQINKKNYMAARELAELFRHERRSTSDALRYYQQAATYAPKTGRERALIFREWGMILKASGLPNATDQALDKFEEAVRHNDVDKIAIHALADMYARKQQYVRVIELLTPLADDQDTRTKRLSLVLLIRAHEAQGNLLQAATYKSTLETLPEDSTFR